MVAVPLAVIFAVLFASADPVFARAVGNVLGFRIDLGGLPGRILFVVAAGLAGGRRGLGLGPRHPRLRGRLARRGQPDGADPGHPRARAPEALVILVLVDLVIALFVGLQFAYLFGGRAANGMAYADYARRGFFELVAAACLSSVVVIVLESTVVRRTRPYLAALIALIALTGVVLASAALRLRLYQDAYGWTELRLYVLAAIITIGLGLAAMAALVLADRSRWIPHTLAVLGVCSLVALNLVAPAAFVASQNVARVIDPSLVPPDGHAGLDTEYLAVLPDDAIPVLVEALPRLPPEVADEVAPILRARKVELAADPSYASVFAWNLGRERARDALDALFP